MPNIRARLETRISAAIAAAWPDAADAPAIVQAAADARFGDYQANGAMALAKRLGASPREVAQRVVEQLKEDAELAAMAETPEIAGPGFINFTLRPEWVAERLGEVNADVADGSGTRPEGEDRLGVEPTAEPETVVVDYSAPNLAKEMHVHAGEAEPCRRLGNAVWDAVCILRGLHCLRRSHAVCLVPWRPY